jgi:pimeloyl-ACP methyl ester carboxylesterase
MTAEPFRIDVPDDTLTDLRERLQRTRYAPPLGNGDWSGGIDSGTLRGLVDAWLNDFDWRAQEARLTLATLYWVTDSIGTSFRQYFDHDSNPPRPPIVAPVGVYLSREPAMEGFPPSLASRAALDVREFVRAPAGGHFAGLEQPERTADAIRAFFGTLHG